MDAGSPKRRKRLLITLGAICIQVLFYILSIGPAVVLNKRGFITVETLALIYLPLNLVASGIPGATELIDSYINLWV
jgi:hypothetical protein